MQNAKNQKLSNSAAKEERTNDLDLPSLSLRNDEEITLQVTSGKNESKETKGDKEDLKMKVDQQNVEENLVRKIEIENQESEVISNITSLELSPAESSKVIEEASKRKLENQKCSSTELEQHDQRTTNQDNARDLNKRAAKNESDIAFMSKDSNSKQ